MDFLDHLKALATKLPGQLPHLQTEEATKNALVMPFIRSLGYDVFDPTEVRPELDADVGVKKGEKVDYAILREGKPIILFECKKVGTDLGTIQFSQLFRYFTVTDARFAVLTNGVQYRFFTDLESSNKMDERPFLEFDLQDFKDHETEELKKFSKAMFDVDSILSTATELKYTREFKRVLGEEMNAPSEELVILLTKRVYEGRLTQPVKDQFSAILRRAFQQMVNERISKSLQAALDGTQAQAAELSTSQEPVPPVADEEGKIITTPEEWEGFYIVRAILRELIDPKRIVIRDALSYCSILFDDNNRKPICRMRFNGSKKYLGLFNEQKEEEKVLVEDLSDIYQHSERLKQTVTGYLGS